jgi:hypothetical protein
MKAALEFIGQLIDKLKLAFVWVAGYFTGKKVEKLQHDNKYLKLKAKALKHKQEKEKAIVSKWDKIRKRVVIPANPSNQPTILQSGSEESAIILNEDGDELRIDRE